MPWYGFLHPLMAIGTIAFGVVTAQTSLARINEWNFPLRKQRYRSVVLLMMVAVNFVVGFIVTAFIRGPGRELKLPGHRPLAVVAIVLAVLCALVTFTKGKRGELPSPMRLHPVMMMVLLVVMFTMGFITVLSVFGI
jgi:magnesium-transporting ATPase (P-type)